MAPVYFGWFSAGWNRGGTTFAFDLAVQGRLATGPAEDNFMGKERYPFIGRRQVSRAAADQFMFAVRMPDQFGSAKLLNDPVGVAVGNEVI